jgi:hypothetical protein
VNVTKWIGLLGIAFIPNAHAQLMTSLELKDECALVEQMVATANSPPMVLLKGTGCLTYIRGYLDAVMYMEVARGAKRLLCGEATTHRQWAAMYVKYANAHPEQWNSPAANSFANVVAEAAPCK